MIGEIKPKIGMELFQHTQKNPPSFHYTTDTLRHGYKITIQSCKFTDAIPCGVSMLTSQVAATALS